MNPQFPVYIPSKGRASTRLTSKALERIGVPYHIVVEEQEHAAYAAEIDPKKILVLDREYQRNYDTFDDLGDARGKGSGPARNFIWDHAIASGAKWHWIMDDNIRGFWRLNNNLKIPVSSGTVLRCMEDFVLRYANVAMAGPNYYMFASRKTRMPPFTLNTRIYSCNLIRNDMPYRWRGRFNEDTDLSLRMLKDGWCTILFNAFLQWKMTTMTMKGGNTDSIYVGGTVLKSQMIARMHPDVARVAQRFGRCHHYVDYRPFRANKLIRRPDAEVPEGVNDYGMRLRTIRERAPNEAPKVLLRYGPGPT